MSSIDVDGVKIFWIERGAGQPVLFVHGIPTDYRAWNSQVDAVSGRFRAITYSRRYAYPNVRDGDVLESTVQTNANDLRALIEKLGVSPVHLVGHSYGGFIAAYLATRQPNLVRSLVLVEPAIATLLLKNPKSKIESLFLLLRDPSVAFSASKFIRKSNNPALKALKAGDSEGAVRLNLDGVQDRVGALEGFADDVRKMMLDNGKTVKEGGTVLPVLAKADLKRIECQTLVVNGETGALWLRRIGKIAATSIPSCTKAKISGAGHYPHIERPSEFNRVLLDFLSRNGTP